MAKKKDELLEDEEVENIQYTEVSETTEEESKEATTQKTYKDQVIEFVKSLIDKYKKKMIKEDTDSFFLNGINDDKKSEDECVNFVMNDLTSKRIMMGDDEIIYGLIHDYYVDSVKAGDNWSQYLDRSNAHTRPVKKVELTDAEKEKLKAKAEAEFIEEQKRKLEEEEKKRIEKEKARLQKQKEREAEKEVQKAIEEQKAKEEAKKKGAAEQLSLFGD